MGPAVATPFHLRLLLDSARRLGHVDASAVQKPTFNERHTQCHNEDKPDERWCLKLTPDCLNCLLRGIALLGIDDELAAALPLASAMPLAWGGKAI